MIAFDPPSNQMCWGCLIRDLVIITDIFLCGGPQFESKSCVGRKHDLIGVTAGSNMIVLLLCGPQFESNSSIARTHDLIGIAVGSKMIMIKLRSSRKTVCCAILLRRHYNVMLSHEMRTNVGKTWIQS